MNDFKMKIPSSLEKVMNRLWSAGYEAYAVGGCVRDSLLGKTPSDYDLTTSATPEEVLSVFGDSRCIETGLKHGTVTVISDGENIEITTYRIDGEYVDNRHPSEVYFTRELKEDLSRRDFTVNAMAYSERAGLVDLFMGREHLLEKRIVCVGDPHDRFHEDGLRILRALRFASVLGFEIDNKTGEKVFSESYLLKNISAERIYAEFSKLICGVGACDILINYKRVLEEFLCFDCDKEEYERRVKTLVLAPKKHYIRLAILFGNKKSVRENLAALKTDKFTRDRASLLADNASAEIPDDEISLKKLVSRLGFEVFDEYVSIRKAYGDPLCDKARKIAHDAEEKKECLFLKDLAVSGSDICALGAAGKEIGDILFALLDEVIEGRCENTPEKLRTRASEMIAKPVQKGC